MAWGRVSLRMKISRPLAAVRTDHRLNWPHRFCIEWLKRRGDGVLRRIKLGGRPELQHLADPCGVVALRRMPEAEVAMVVSFRSSTDGPPHARRIKRIHLPANYPDRPI
jgi:hypothetical protein